MNRFFYVVLVMFVVQVSGATTILHLDQPKGEAFALKQSFLQNLKTIFNAPIFIETGTYKGDTTAVAATVFEEVHSIELGNILWQQAQQRFADRPHVFLYCANGPDALAQLLPTIDARSILWLDSHWSGGDTVLGSENTPILKELQAIKDSGHKNLVIMIDDIRCFDPECRFYASGMHKGYPSVQELKKSILAINKNYVVYIMGDILIAFLKQDEVHPSSIVEACTQSRFFKGKRNVEDMIRLEMNHIGAADGQEAEAIETLFHMFAERGYAKDYALWFGLIKLYNKEYAAAYSAFEHAVKAGFEHWRIHWYLAQAAHGMGDQQCALMHVQKVVKQARGFEEAKMFYQSLISV